MSPKNSGACLSTGWLAHSHSNGWPVAGWAASNSFTATPAHGSVLTLVLTWAWNVLLPDPPGGMSPIEMVAVVVLPGISLSAYCAVRLAVTPVAGFVPRFRYVNV